jgi:CRP-like cAMP-binding protein
VTQLRPHPSNRILACLTSSNAANMLPHLRVIELPQELVLFESGGTVDRVIFPHAGIVSIVVGLTTGEMIEAAMVGREGVVGGVAALDGNISIGRAIVQAAGAGSVLDVNHVRELAEQDGEFRAQLIRYDQFVLAQSQQSVACNAIHKIEERLARWLLRCRDLLDSDDLPLTQEFIAQMLAVRRTSVSIAANNLQKAGLIRYKRGHIRVLNLEGLREAACECYETVSSLSRRLIGTSEA